MAADSNFRRSTIIADAKVHATVTVVRMGNSECNYVTALKIKYRFNTVFLMVYSTVVPTVSHHNAHIPDVLIANKVVKVTVLLRFQKCAKKSADTQVFSML